MWLQKLSHILGAPIVFLPAVYSFTQPNTFNSYAISKFHDIGKCNDVVLCFHFLLYKMKSPNKITRLYLGIIYDYIQCFYNVIVKIIYNNM